MTACAICTTTLTGSLDAYGPIDLPVCAACWSAVLTIGGNETTAIIWLSKTHDAPPGAARQMSLLEQNEQAVPE